MKPLEYFRTCVSSRHHPHRAYRRALARARSVSARRALREEYTRFLQGPPGQDLFQEIERMNEASAHHGDDVARA